jgi:hypothetical protein
VSSTELQNILAPLIGEGKRKIEGAAGVELVELV